MSPQGIAVSTDLEQQYRTAKGPIARSPWQMIWLLAQGLASALVAAVTGYMANWVRTSAPCDNQHGPTGLGNRRHHHPASAGPLSAAQRTALAGA